MAWWPAVVFGWPAIAVALTLSVAGITRDRPILLNLAALIALPFCFYLAGSPAIGWLAMIAPVLLIAAGISMHYQRTKLAWAMLVPFLVLVGWVATAVLNQ